MTAVKAAKQPHNQWGNEIDIVEVVYDFSVDGGAIGSLDLFTQAQDAVVVKSYMKVLTACTSGGSATVSVGKATDAAGIVAATPVASLTVGAVIAGTSGGQAYKLAAGDVPQIAIGTAALTAGKIAVVLQICKF